jgi:hypothetical protein
LVDRMRLKTWFMAVVFAACASAWAGETGMQGRFSESGLDAWESKSFAGETDYRLVTVDGMPVVRAQSEGAASALVYRGRVDLKQTPFLNWSWRKLQGIDPGDENARSGDDFVARVYVIIDGGLLFWKSRALNYVWSFQHRVGEAWDNPFAGPAARMLALRDASHGEGVWYHERRDVASDFRDFRGEQVRYIDGVAIMTDSDNSASRALAEYGDIWFSAAPGAVKQ